MYLSSSSSFSRRALQRSSSLSGSIGSSTSKSDDPSDGQVGGYPFNLLPAGDSPRGLKILNATGKIVDSATQSSAQVLENLARLGSAFGFSENHQALLDKYPGAVRTLYLLCAHDNAPLVPYVRHNGIGSFAPRFGLPDQTWQRFSAAKLLKLARAMECCGFDRRMVLKLLKAAVSGACKTAADCKEVLRAWNKASYFELKPIPKAKLSWRSRSGQKKNPGMIGAVAVKRSDLESLRENLLQNILDTEDLTRLEWLRTGLKAAQKAGVVVSQPCEEEDLAIIHDLSKVILELDAEAKEYRPVVDDRPRSERARPALDALVAAGLETDMVEGRWVAKLNGSAKFDLKLADVAFAYLENAAGNGAQPPDLVFAIATMMLGEAGKLPGFDWGRFAWPYVKAAASNFESTKDAGFKAAMMPFVTGWAMTTCIDTIDKLAAGQPNDRLCAAALRAFLAEEWFDAVPEGLKPVLASARKDPDRASQGSTLAKLKLPEETRLALAALVCRPMLLSLDRLEKDLWVQPATMALTTGPLTRIVASMSGDLMHQLQVEFHLNGLLDREALPLDIRRVIQRSIGTDLDAGEVHTILESLAERRVTSVELAEAAHDHGAKAMAQMRDILAKGDYLLALHKRCDKWARPLVMASLSKALDAFGGLLMTGDIGKEQIKAMTNEWVDFNKRIERARIPARGKRLS